MTGSDHPGQIGREEEDAELQGGGQCGMKLFVPPLCTLKGNTRGEWSDPAYGDPHPVVVPQHLEQAGLPHNTVSDKLVQGLPPLHTPALLLRAAGLVATTLALSARKTADARRLRRAPLRIAGQHCLCQKPTQRHRPAEAREGVQELD